MGSIRRQIATFFAVLAVLYAGGFIAGQLIDEEPKHDKDAGSMTAPER